MHKNQYLQFFSHHPLVHKQAVIRMFFTRASRLSSSNVHRSAEERHVVKALKKNEYPSQLIQRHHLLGSQKRDNTYHQVDHHHQHRCLSPLREFMTLKDSACRILITSRPGTYYPCAYFANIFYACVYDSVCIYKWFSCCPLPVPVMKTAE